MLLDAYNIIMLAVLANRSFFVCVCNDDGEVSHVAAEAMLTEVLACDSSRYCSIILDTML